MNVGIYVELLCERPTCRSSLKKLICKRPLPVTFLLTCFLSSFSFIVLETRFHVLQAGLWLVTYPRMTLNFWTSCSTSWVRGSQVYTLTPSLPSAEGRLTHTVLAGRALCRWAPPSRASCVPGWFLCLSRMFSLQAALPAHPLSFSTLCWQPQSTFPYKF